MLWATSFGFAQRATPAGNVLKTRLFGVTIRDQLAAPGLSTWPDRRRARSLHAEGGMSWARTGSSGLGPRAQAPPTPATNASCADPTRKRRRVMVWCMMASSAAEYRIDEVPTASWLNRPTLPVAEAVPRIGLSVS